MKATTKGVLARLKGRKGKVKPVDTAPVIAGEVPETDLPVNETTSFTLLYAAIDRADSLDINSGTRRAAMVGMDVLCQTDPGRMWDVIELSGAMAGESLRRVIMELAGIGRAHVANGHMANI